MKKILLLILIILLMINTVSALNIKTVNVDTLSPGSIGVINIKIENNLDYDAQQVSLILQFTGMPFIPVGSSEDSTSEITESREKTLTYTIKASNEIRPGDYEILYILTYNIDDGEKITPYQKSGSIGVRVRGNPDLAATATLENPVIGEKGQIKLKIINKGFYNARYAILKIEYQGLILISENEEYIGNIDSDDFETTTFDAIFNNLNPQIKATIKYKDFDNLDITREFNLPLTIYTKDQAVQLGIITTNKNGIYITLIILLIITWIVVRRIKKKRKLKRSMQNY